MKSRIKSHLLTKDQDALILGRANNHSGYINKSAINKLQSIPWELNIDILDDLHDSLKPSDEPLSPLEQKEREKSYTLRERETIDVIDYLLENGNKFYFGWKYCKRGRMYSQGYHINPQGNEYRKAMLSFHDKHALDTEGVYYLIMDIANTMGYDKASWFTRRVKAKAIIADIFEDEATISEKTAQYSAKADDSLLFIKAIKAYHNGVILGKPIGHNMGFDATASGLQIMSAMSGCATTARHSNVHAMVSRTYTDEAQQRLEELEAELASLK